ncbi:MAG TPA: hypothetical protein DIW47_06610 [Bacteroidetes bacterium]|nr:hypothetical protein [Bacteroidota bacterium]
MDKHVLAYSIYLLVTTVLTVIVGRTLFRNGRVFLRDIFHGNLELAEAVDRLLLVGYYLVNIGYAVFSMNIAREILSQRELMETLSLKIGTIILIFGAMHFFNMFVFFKLRKREQYGL